MPPAKPALQRESTSVSNQVISPVQRKATVAGPGGRSTLEVAPVPLIRAVPPPIETQPRRSSSFQPRVPVITGEATYRGAMPVDGIISGNLGATGSTLIVKQRPKSGPIDSTPELDGEISFKDMLRINGHVAGRVFSYNGTLIVDGSARVDATIDVSVCMINGTVNGDVMAHQRVELGSGAIINGNIATRSITMKPGAVFHGDCRMLKDEEEP